MRIPPYIRGLLVTVIGDYAFEGEIYETWENNEASWVRVRYITAITIPDSVTHIGYMAFLHNKLTSVVIPSGITRINDVHLRVINSRTFSFQMP